MNTGSSCLGKLCVPTWEDLIRSFILHWVTKSLKLLSNWTSRMGLLIRLGCVQSLTQSDLLILMSFSGSFNLASSGFLIAPFLIQFNNSIMSDSCYPMDCSMPGFPVHHQHPELAQTHVHWVGDAILHLILCCPLLFLPWIFPSIRVFSNESVLCIRWPKLEFQL